MHERHAREVTCLEAFETARPESPSWTDDNDDDEPGALGGRLAHDLVDDRLARAEPLQRVARAIGDEDIGRRSGGDRFERDAVGPCAVVVGPARRLGSRGLERLEAGDFAGVALVHRGDLATEPRND